MEDIHIKLDISPELNQEFKEALEEVINGFVNNLKLCLAKKIVSKSKFTEQDAIELSNKVNKAIHNKL